MQQEGATDAESLMGRVDPEMIQATTTAPVTHRPPSGQLLVPIRNPNGVSLEVFRADRQFGAPGGEPFVSVAVRRLCGEGEGTQVWREAGVGAGEREAVGGSSFQFLVCSLLWLGRGFQI